MLGGDFRSCRDGDCHLHLNLCRGYKAVEQKKHTLKMGASSSLLPQPVPVVPGPARAMHLDTQHQQNPQCQHAAAEGLQRSHRPS